MNYEDTTVDFGHWFLTLFLVNIPIIGIILLLIWSFSTDINPSKRNFARAYLLWAVIIMIVSVIVISAAVKLLSYIMPY